MDHLLSMELNFYRKNRIKSSGFGFIQKTLIGYFKLILLGFERLFSLKILFFEN